MSAARVGAQAEVPLDGAIDAPSESPLAGAGFDDDLLIREQASNLRSLIVLSTLMTESGDERQIVHLMATSVSSFADCRLEGVYLQGGGEAGITPAGAGWSHAGNLPETARQHVERKLSGLAGVGGEIRVPGAAWAYAFPLRSLAGHHGFLVVSAAEALTRRQSFLLGVLAQQTGVAVANARLLSELRSTSEELSSANAALTRSVSELQRSLEIHERLTHAAASGLGREGLAQTLHQLTKFPVAIEDRWGNLRAWAGGEAPDPYPKDSAQVREQLIRRLQREGGPYRERGRLVGLASPRPDATGVIALVDPEQRAGPFEQMALEHASTVLAVELARLHSLGEAELRLRRDLVEELLQGTDDESALGRAQALGHDLECPHRVVIVVGVGRSRDEDQFLHAVRTAARHFGMGTLIVARSGTVVVLADHDPGWGEFRQAVMRESGGVRCQVAVGGECLTPGEFPRSYREAQLALSLQRATEAEVVSFDDLGVYRILSGAQDIAAIERFINDQLGALLAYDAKKGSDLVLTLHQYMECGGNYEATAQALLVHRSTLKYRLQRIRAITEQDLNCPDSRFNLHLATRAWQTLRALRSTTQGAGSGPLGAPGRIPR